MGEHEALEELRTEETCGLAHAIRSSNWVAVVYWVASKERR
jgi:hypothetical protein